MSTPTPARAPSREARARGFTLIELMVTLTIVAILASVAYPAYRNYVIRGQVVNATNGLSAVAANMERYFQDNRTYAAANGFTPPCTVTGTNTNIYGTFTVACATAPTATTFSITATGSGQTAGFTYTIDQLGDESSAVASPAPTAWILTCPTTWETKAGTC